MSSHTSPESHRRRLYETMNDADRSLAEKQRQALAIGRAFLGVDNGHIQRHDADGIHEVVASAGAERTVVPEGTVVDRATTYCRRTVERDSPLALSDASEQGWADDPAYREHGLECYLGTTLFVDGEVYGTVCFVSADARETAFEAEEKAFVELLARLLGREIESERHADELAARERAHSDSEDKYESVLRAAPNAIFLVDVGGGDIVEANDAAADLTGYDRAALLGMDVNELSSPGDRAKHRAQFRRFVESEGTCARFADGSQIAVRRADGREVPVEISASVVELDGRELLHTIVRDISDRRERERERRVRNRAIEEASVGITVADATDDSLPLVYANDEFERITGYDNGFALGRNCRFLQGPGTDEAALDELRAGLEGREPVTTELLNYRADDTPFWNELTLAPVTEPDGEAVSHFVGFQRDITGRKRRERLIDVLNRVLRHNLRNDMTVVRGYAELIAERADGEPAAMAERIVDAASGLTALSEKARALDAAMREPAPPQVRDVAADTRAVAEELREAFPEAEVSVAGRETCRAVSTERIRLALRELGENAVEHGEGPVVFRVERTDEGRAAVRVDDRGPGLPQIEQRVLESGRETPLEHGQGLGLWLVNWLVTGIGGEVRVDVDDGTTVTATLPPVPDDDEVPPDRYRRAAISTGDR